MSRYLYRCECCGAEVTSPKLLDDCPNGVRGKCPGPLVRFGPGSRKSK